VVAARTRQPKHRPSPPGEAWVCGQHNEQARARVELQQEGALPNAARVQMTLRASKWVRAASAVGWGDNAGRQQAITHLRWRADGHRGKVLHGFEGVQLDALHHLQPSPSPSPLHLCGCGAMHQQVDSALFRLLLLQLQLAAAGGGCRLGRKPNTGRAGRIPSVEYREHRAEERRSERAVARHRGVARVISTNHHDRSVMRPRSFERYTGLYRQFARPKLQGTHARWTITC
jgi:hypothetical protein